MKISDSIPNEECYTKKELAEEFGLSFSQMDKLVKKALKERLLPDISKKDGVRTIYPVQMVEKFKELRSTGKLGEIRHRSKVIERNAKLLLQVPIYDGEYVEVLRQAFGSDQNMAVFLKNYLESTIKPIIARKHELEQEATKQISKELSEKFNLYKQSAG